MITNKMAECFNHSANQPLIMKQTSYGNSELSALSTTNYILHRFLHEPLVKSRINPSEACVVARQICSRLFCSGDPIPMHSVSRSCSTRILVYISYLLSNNAPCCTSARSHTLIHPWTGRENVCMKKHHCFPSSYQANRVFFLFLLKILACINE